MIVDGADVMKSMDYSFTAVDLKIGKQKLKKLERNPGMYNFDRHNNEKQ